jgi:glyoxylase-like metal-dependent hydrolase (beta-lactamase superfamily II)
MGTGAPSGAQVFRPEPASTARPLSRSAVDIAADRCRTSRVFFQQFRAGGCLSYLIGDESSGAAAVVDPEDDQIERYLAVAAEKGLNIHYVIDTHTHADHFSALAELGRKLRVPMVMHHGASAPFVDMRVGDGETLRIGALRLVVRHTPGHTADSMCLDLADRVLTGDTLLIGATGRTDLPTGDPAALHDSLFGCLLRLDDAKLVFPAHDYKGREHSTIGDERASNVRLQKRDRDAFVQMMSAHNPSMPTHLTEALRTNRTGAKTVNQLLTEAAARVTFMSMEELARRAAGGEPDLVILDVRERDEFERGHVRGAKHIPRGQLELRLNAELPDPTVRIVTVCRLGKISTLAAATLRTLGYERAVALDGGMDSWVGAGLPVESA